MTAFYQQIYKMVVSGTASSAVFTDLQSLTGEEAPDRHPLPQTDIDIVLLGAAGDPVFGSVPAALAAENGENIFIACSNMARFLRACS